MVSSISEWLWIIYDIIALAIIIFLTIANAKRGFGLIIISTVGYVVSCVIASSASNMFGPAFYDNLLKNEIIEKTSEAVSKYSVTSEIKECISDMTMGLNIKEADIEKFMKKSDAENFDSNIYKFINSKSSGAVSSVDEATEYIVNSINKSMENLFDGKIPLSMVKDMCSFSVENKTEAFTLLKLFSEDMESRETAEYIEEHYIRKYAVMFVKTFLFIIIFFALMVIFKIAEGKAISNDKVFILGKFDKAGGLVIGLIESFAVVFILCILVRFALLLSDGSAVFFNEDVINQSKIFSVFYNFNLMG
ncbi:MAG: hypothetical protein ACI4JM_08715 [Oscillospiraceae bacterium]